MKTLSLFLLAGISSSLAQPVSAADAAKFTEKVIWSFEGGTDGAGPRAGLINVNGVLYGTTELGGHTDCEQNGDCGTVFSVDPNTGTERVLYAFCSLENCADGQYPQTGLLDVNGILYGTTQSGGGMGVGVAFTLNPSTGAESVLYSFCSQNACTDGAGPSTLIDVKGELYGTTGGGGAYGAGTIFALDPDTGSETVLYSFGDNGLNPDSAPADVNGILYGTTSEGGTDNCGRLPSCGTVYSFNLRTGTEKVIYFFEGADGADPVVSPIAEHGFLYGTAPYGGVSGCRHDGCGTVFAINLSSGDETTLYSFCSRGPNCPDGAEPYGALIEMKGALYGTTLLGGMHKKYGEGTVFSLDPITGSEKTVHSFCDQRNCPDGAYPFAGLIDINGALYGTTYGGGTYGQGTVFSLSRN